MFKIKKDRKIWYPVEINTLTENGEPLIIKISVQYSILPRKELIEKQREQSAYERNLILSPEENVGDKDKEFEEWFFAHVHDWKDVIGEDDKPVLFSVEDLRAVCDIDQPFFIAILTCLFRASAGTPAKNLKSGVVT